MNPRYELKYFVSPDQALRIRDFVREYLDLDEHCLGKVDYSYPVHTLHLDSDDWKLYWRTVRGDQDRWKLRLRYYSSQPDSPVFCEVKHQMTDVILKYRGGVRPEAVDTLLGGCLPEPGHFCSRSPKEAMAVERFVTMQGEWNARPRLHICCLREAYESNDGKARVTLDRSICVSEVSGDSSALLPTGMDNPLMSANHTVILELRFTDRFPDWYRELVRIFSLSQPLFWKGEQGKISCHGLHLTQGELIYSIVL
jgi:hypothetical protein